MFWQDILNYDSEIGNLSQQLGYTGDQWKSLSRIGKESNRVELKLTEFVNGLVWM